MELNIMQSSSNMSTSDLMMERRVLMEQLKIVGHSAAQITECGMNFSYSTTGQLAPWRTKCHWFTSSFPPDHYKQSNRSHLQRPKRSPTVCFAM